MIETDNWKFVKAKYFTPYLDGRRHVRVIVVHSAESLERNDSAESVAHYFQIIDRPASAHVCVDSDSVIQCVKDRDIAYAAPGCNGDGLSLELSGKAAQSAREWLDGYGLKMLDNGASVVAQWALKFGIPLKHLSNAELKNGQSGIIGHYQASEVYKRSSHTDPGPNFPWTYFLERAQSFYEERKKKLGLVS